MDATAVVGQGEWLDGPDGRREADVLVTGTVDGAERRVLIECKDYNPATTWTGRHRRRRRTRIEAPRP